MMYLISFLCGIAFTLMSVSAVYFYNKPPVVIPEEKKEENKLTIEEQQDKLFNYTVETYSRSV